MRSNFDSQFLTRRIKKGEQAFCRNTTPKIEIADVGKVLKAESLQKQEHKSRCRGVRPNRASRFNYVHLRREAHPTVPTLSCVDERPHRTWSEQVATKCACCQGPSHRVVRERARPLSQVVWARSMSTPNGVEGGGLELGPPRHAAVMSMLAAIIDEIQVSQYV